MKYAEEKVFKLKILLEKVLMLKYCKTKVQEEQFISKKQIEVFG